ncbi:hypothetical protein ILUMI_10751 [Ignelater luminosus]|uniref:BHLH domain-containing protein n=1 Tax=Ignelater luminosus TaxID=2038154 RepID=A0A8K0GEL9_IGNLU|nr:hypothetical protein ILUMI_10751 [Ignelater luminosus]
MVMKKCKCRVWEKVRRDKLKKCFVNLSKLLPNYDPSLTLSNIEILQKAAVYIEELQQKLKDVLTGEEGVKKTEREEIKALYERIKKLLTRNEQLSNLLRDAGIRIPTEYGSIKNFKEPLRWSNKITPEQAKELAEKEAQKENEKQTDNPPKKPKLNNKSDAQKTKSTKPQKKDTKNSVKKSKTKKPTVISVQLSNVIPSQQTVAKSSQPCFIIASNSPIALPQACNKTSKAASTVVSSSLAVPKVASVITPPSSTIISKVNSKLSSLGPGTLILANGNVVPILPQPTAVLPAPTILTNPTPILLKPPSSNTTFIVMPTKNSKEINITKSTSSTTSSLITASSTILSNATIKAFTRIRPRIGVTKTTQVNKVPIPALTSHYSNLSSAKAVVSTTQSDNKKPADTESKKKVAKKRKVLSKTICNKPINQKRLKINESIPTSQSENVNKIDVNLGKLAKNVEKNKDREKNAISSDTAISVNLDDGKSVDADTNRENSTKTNKDDKEDDKNKEKTEEIGNDSTNLITNKAELTTTSAEDLETLKIQNTKSQVTNLTVPIDNDQSSVQETKGTKTSTDTVEINERLSDKDAEIISATTNNDTLINSTTVAITSSTNSITTSSSTGTVASTKPVISNIPAQEIQEKNLELGMNLNHSELSNDIFSSLQVPIGGQNPESTSPTAAFLLAFPLVSSLTGVKVTEVIEEENSDSRHGTPTLLQIGTMDTTKTTQSIHTESLTPNLLNLDNFSFFSSGKDNFYSTFDNSNNNVYPVQTNQVLDQNTKSSNCDKQDVLTSTKKTQEKEVTSIEHPTSKPNTITQNNYVRQNNSTSYSKASTVSSSYTSETPHLVHYDSRQKISNTNSTISINRKNTDSIQTSIQYNNTSTSNVGSVAQCNTYNPFSDFSKSSTVHTYSTFSKPYNDPLYTNSSHYNYSQNTSNTFDQNAYYPSKSTSSSLPVTKASNITTPYCATSTYSETSYIMDCKTKRDSTNQRHNNNSNNNSINYYSHNQNNKTQPKEKFSSHSASSKSSKSSNNQPKPPINWMTTPDFRSQPSNTDYLVPPFAKEIDYNPNSFYSSNSFASTTHTSYFNATSTMYSTPEFQNTVIDNRKTFDSSLPIISSTNSVQRSEFEENQFSWSPTKLPQFLETPHSFVSSTLPTLVGDLALGTTQSSFNEQKVDSATVREHNIVKSKDNNRRPKVHPVNYDHNQSNFLSVSQLVENKTDLTSGSNSRTTNRRNSGNRNTKNNSHKGNKHSHKAAETKELIDGSNQLDVSSMEKKPNVNYPMQGVNGNANNWLSDCNNKPRHSHKNPQSSYSAEALIGHQDQTDNILPKQRYRQQQPNYASVNKTIPIPSFLSDNIVPYFPPVELPQDNNFMQTNPNYQSSSLSHSFPTSVQNNPAYPPGTFMSTGSATITSSYLQTSGLIPEFATHDYSATVPDNSVITDKVPDTKHCNRPDGIKQGSNNSNNRTEDRSNVSQQINADCSANSSNFMKKSSKHKHSSENNLPGIVDFGFLSMPNTINSPILPDDFHAHSNFLPPPTPSQLYSCKNPLYSKQPTDLNSGSLLPLPPVPVSRGASQHFDGSTSNASSSLTSFNLSAIFPEINKGAVPLSGLYSEPSRNKNYNFQRNYLSSTVQVSFNNNSKSSSSNYVNAVATTYAPSN